MNPDLNKAGEILSQGHFTCVICRGDEVYTTMLRGVRPLLDYLEQGTDLTGACAADKVVGKAAALLYCLLSVRAVHARVMSRAAWQVLESHGIAVSCDMLVDAIENRTKTGMCPMEMATAHVDDPALAPAAIRAKLAELAGN